MKQIQQRLAGQLSLSHVKEVQLFLTREDLEALVEALCEFAHMIYHFFPQNAETEAVIESVTTWQRRITRIIAEFEA